MYSISEVAEQTGFSAHTLRYYEKIGLLSSPTRHGGKRLYTDGEVRLLQFMKVLKNTGMSLEDILEFLVDGCLLENKDAEQDRNAKVQKRKNILEKHLLTLEQQKKELEMVIQLTEEKLATYQDMLEEEQNEKR
ncbi:MerR family transcriptional regulator [Neobacillus drentensis]|uniref:MerR family transcriptional regulator n=1 Tax=Neobacillus drentensis TaxID=220684 RepID=UPI002FFF7478